ncbi:hypothetical protein L209DRAFT_617448 [Thermothelomyces heterothallicus CBS 203.75]
MWQGRRCRLGRTRRRGQTSAAARPCRANRRSRATRTARAGLVSAALRRPVVPVVTAAVLNYPSAPVPRRLVIAAYNRTVVLYTSVYLPESAELIAAGR